MLTQWHVVPFDVVCVSQVVTLHLFLDIVQNNSGCYEVNHLPCWQLIEITAGVTTPVTIATQVKGHNKVGHF